MGISRTLISGGISNKEALTGFVLPKDFIKAPESVVQSLMPQQPTLPSLAPPPPTAQEPSDQAAGAKAAASTQASQKRNAFGTASLIGD